MNKRPTNGINTNNRRSNMTSKNNRWKEQLVQGISERENKDALRLKLEREQSLQKELKAQCRKETLQLNIELGFVEIDNDDANKTQDKMPEWKKQKLFLADVFPPPVKCRKYKGQEVFKNKQAMQEYYYKIVTPEEWEKNQILLAEMREVFDQQQKTEESITEPNESETMVDKATELQITEES